MPYTFAENSPPDYILEPLLFLSVISTESKLGDVIDKSFYYKSSHANNVLDFFNTLRTSDALYYSVSATKGTNSLKFASSSRNVISLSLCEHTFFHLAYVGRYARFTKDIPAKGSPGLETTYNAELDMSDTTQRYYKDVVALVSAVFDDAELSVLVDYDLDLSALQQLQLQRVDPVATSTCISTHSDLSPLGSKHIGPDLEFDFYEYLCLLHLNALPNLADSHVQNTTMYSIPETDSTALSTPLHLHSVSDVGPAVFYDLVNAGLSVSVLARTGSKHYVTFNTGTIIYFWQFE